MARTIRPDAETPEETGARLAGDFASQVTAQHITLAFGHAPWCNLPSDHDWNATARRCKHVVLTIPGLVEVGVAGPRIATSDDGMAMIEDTVDVDPDVYIDYDSNGSQAGGATAVDAQRVHDALRQSFVTWTMALDWVAGRADWFAIKADAQQ